MRLFAPNELHSDLTSPKGPKTQYKGWKKKIEEQQTKKRDCNRKINNWHSFLFS